MSHHIIYIPGLHDQHVWNKHMSKLIPLFWKPYGFTGHIFAPHWEEGNSIKPKIEQVLQMIDYLHNQGAGVSLIGQSAGGSLALNAFYERKDIINGAINVTGRLRQGANVSPTLEKAAGKSKAFIESVRLFERENEPRLTRKDRQKIMTIRPSYDGVVPFSTVPLNGATNRVSPIPGHSTGGVFICTFYSKIMLNFLMSLKILIA